MTIAKKAVVKKTRVKKVIAEYEDIIEPIKMKREIKLSDEVLIMNNTSGQLVMISTSTRRQWILKDYGKKARMTVSDIIDITSDQPIIFEDGWALILDDDVVTYLNYNDIYDTLPSVEQMQNLIKLPIKELNILLPNLPKSLKLDCARIVIKKINEGEIDSRNKIEVFQTHLNFETK